MGNLWYHLFHLNNTSQWSLQQFSTYFALWKVSYRSLTLILEPHILDKYENIIVEEYHVIHNNMLQLSSALFSQNNHKSLSFWPFLGIDEWIYVWYRVNANNIHITTKDIYSSSYIFTTKILRNFVSHMESIYHLIMDKHKHLFISLNKVR